jgi:hypothetical protein
MWYFLVTVPQQLHRTWHLLESFAVSFVSLNFVGAVRIVLLTDISLIGALLISATEPSFSWVFSQVAPPLYG